jgi:hypothetical protein
LWWLDLDVEDDLIGFLQRKMAFLMKNAYIG